MQRGVDLATLGAGGERDTLDDIPRMAAAASSRSSGLLSASARRSTLWR